MVSLIKSEKIFSKKKYIAVWDQVVMAVAIDNRVAKETMGCYATVELFGELSRGRTVVDWPNKLQKEPNVNIITAVDQKLFQEMIMAVV